MTSENVQPQASLKRQRFECLFMRESQLAIQHECKLIKPLNITTQKQDTGIALPSLAMFLSLGREQLLFNSAQHSTPPPAARLGCEAGSEKV